MAQRATTRRSCRTKRRVRSIRGSVRFSKWVANCCKGFRAGIHHLRVGVPFSRSILRRSLDSVNPLTNNADAVLMQLPWVRGETTTKEAARRPASDYHTGGTARPGHQLITEDRDRPPRLR